MRCGFDLAFHRRTAFTGGQPYAFAVPTQKRFRINATCLWLPGNFAAVRRLVVLRPEKWKEPSSSEALGSSNENVTDNTAWRYYH
jgi:hypothetical protein